MAKSTKLSETLEDYLEVILDLEVTKKVARAKDIAENMGVRRGSVTSALKNLEERGMINYEPYSFVTLTASGKKIAKEIFHRHIALKSLLLDFLRIDEHTAEATACRMEHALSPETIDRFIALQEFRESGPEQGSLKGESFRKFLRDRRKRMESAGSAGKKEE